MTIDDNEGHYLKVLMDEVFGRRNFVASFAWEKDKGRRNDTDVSGAHDHVLLFARDRSIWSRLRNLMPRTDAQNARYKNPDGDPRGPWLQGDNGTAKSGSESLRYPIALPSGRAVTPPSGNYWRFSRATFEAALADGRVYFGKDGDRLPVIKRFLTDVQQGVVPRTWWPAEEAGSNQSAKRDHLRKLLPDIEPFGTPKPEELVRLAVHIATHPGDLVLDSFLGSGTTAAVAHKMGRRWIGIEMGEHAVTHCLPRLQKVVDGEGGGISAAVGWQGGGGFRLARLGEAVFGADGQINPQVRFAALAAFVWQQATRSAHVSPLPGAVPGTPLLGVHEGQAVYLLYNGILGDRRPAGGNVLTLAVLQALKAACWHAGPKLVYGEACRLGPARLAAEGLVFRQIPYELGAR